MNIELNLSKDFERELERLKRKYGEEFEKINGVHPSQLDYSEFISKFVDNDTLADTTIDPNANANHKDIRSFMTEKGKSSDKLFALNKIFYEIQKKWGLRTAREWLELEYSKAFYLNDAATASFYPYCYAVSLDRLAKEGLFFLSAYNNQPPKHLTTFFDDVIEFVSFLGNRQSGAVGLPNVIVWAYYFWKKDVENNYHNRSPEDYLRQQYQKLIYRLNQPFLRIDQTAFTNVSIFDTPYLEALFGGLEYPDGTFAIDYVEEIKEAEKTFMEVVAETRKTNMFTFPVLTYSLLYVNGEFQDKEFARWCSDHNVEWQDSNFFVSDNVGVLSNCPMAPSTSIFYKSGNEYEIDTIENVYKKHEKDIIKVLSNGQLVDCKINQFKEKAIYKIRLANGVTLKTTAKHYNKVRGCNYKKSCELSTSDYLPFSIIKWAGEGNESYEHGRLFGILYQNGATIRKYIFDKKDSNIQYAQNIIKKEFLGRADVKEFDEYCELFVTGDKIEECVRKYFILSNNNIIGVNSAVLSTSLEFRKGFIEGATQKDGSTNYIICNRTDNDLFDQMISSVGYFVVKQSNGDISYITDPEQLSNYYYISDEEYVWVKIEEIDKVETKSIYSYCLEVVEKGAKSEFTLPSGLVTHNCRLLSDTAKLEGFVNSIGGTALSVGSTRVSTINLVRIAYEVLQYDKFDEEIRINKEEAKEAYLKLLKQRVILDCKALYSMRHIIQRNIEKGLLPNYGDGMLELSKQYCTIGILGLYEVMDLFELIKEDEFGNKYYTDEAIAFAKSIFKVINDIKDSFTNEFSFNVESIPAENCAGVICNADNLLFEQKRYFIYSNQWIPLMEKCTIKEKCRLGSLLDKECSGGAIAHINIENRFPSTDEAWDLLNYVAKTGVIYFAFNTKIGVCPDRHASIGTIVCPICGQPIVDTYTRVVGFYTPTSNYQRIRKKEYSKRKWYGKSQIDETIKNQN